MRIKVGVRILLGFGVIVLLLLTVGVTSYVSFGNIEKLKDEILERNYPGIRASEEIYSAQLNQGLAFRGFLLTGEETFIQRYEEYKKLCSEAIQRSYEMAVTDKGRKLTNNIKTLSSKYDQLTGDIILLKRQGKDEEAIQRLKNEAMPLMDQVRNSIRESIAQREGRMNENAAKINESMENARFLILMVLIASLVASIVISFLVGRSITKPVSQLAGVAQQVAKGDLTVTVPQVSKDEIGDLAQTFNGMVNDLRKVVGQVIEASHELAAGSEELSSSSEETSAATEQIAATVGQVATGATEQAKNIDQASQLLDQVSQAVGQVNISSIEVKESAAKASKAALEGQEGSLLATQKMSQLQKSTEEISRTITELSGVSQQVGEIVNVIKGVADQTNLLALNAAIEAARAGEHGRGFAVVADEVRKLAEECRASADSISQLINNIQTGTNQAVLAMNQGTQDVVEGVKVVQATQEAFALIAQEANQVAKQVAQVSQASQLMAVNSDKTVKAMENIAAVSAQAAASSQEVSASVEEQTATIQAVAAQAEDMAKLAERLQQTVARFQV